MPGKLDLYALGQKGVNVTKSPLALTEDELLQAQNAIVSYEQGRGGLRKRGGLAALNGTALNGGADVLAIKNVPLPLPVSTSGETSRQLFYSISLDWYSSDDGVTFALDTRIAGTDEGAPARGNEALPPPLPGSFIYFYSNTATTRDLYNFDGDAAALVAAVIPPPGYTADTADRLQGGVWHDGALYIGYHRDLGTAPGGRVLKLDPTSGQLTMVGNGFTAGPAYTSPQDFASYNGQLFVACRCRNTGAAPVPTAGRVYRMDTDRDTDWTVDGDFSDVGSWGVESMTKFQNYLYVTVLGTSFTVRRRDANGTWTTVRTTAGPLSTNGVPIVFGFDDVLILYEDGKLYRSTDGSAYTQELDVFATYGDDEPIGKPVIFNGSLFVPTYIGLLKRTAGVSGTWSRVSGIPSSSRFVTVLNVR